ncbi:MAG: 50S ribosomal protein L9 [Deltaproteobacteria bacterium]|nr:50S ribosomal protein L9 [Deltaproteobacteria bacterium]
MQVILKSDVPNLGDAGDVVNVSAGYGRNFLFPRGLAMPSTEGSVRDLEHRARIVEAIKRKQLSEAKALAEKLDGVGITIRREAGDEDKLFGSVTSRDIAEALVAEGYEVERKAIQLDEQIRRIGLFTVPVRLHREVTASIRVYVMRPV